jgi:hypothetical protein
MSRFTKRTERTARQEKDFSSNVSGNVSSLLVKNKQCPANFLVNSLHGEAFLGDETIYGSYRYLERLNTESNERVKKAAEHAAQVAADRVQKAKADAALTASVALVAIIVAKSKAELQISKEMLECKKQLALITAKANEQRKRSALDVKKMRGERTKKNHRFKPLRTSPLGYEKKYKKCCRSNGSTKDLRRAVLTKDLRRAVSP